MVEIDELRGVYNRFRTEYVKRFARQDLTITILSIANSVLAIIGIIIAVNTAVSSGYITAAQVDGLSEVFRLYVGVIVSVPFVKPAVEVLLLRVMRKYGNLEVGA